MVNLVERIYVGREALRKIDEHHYLLPILDSDRHEIGGLDHRFYERYEGYSIGEALKKYSDDVWKEFMKSFFRAEN